MARTIDNLGLDISTRYAQDREIYDESLIKEANLIPQQTGVISTSPFFPSEIDVLLELRHQGTWAIFSPPPRYNASRKRLFVDQLIPPLGSRELQDLKMERIEAIAEKEKNENKNPLTEGIEGEKQALKNLMNQIFSLDEQLIDIYGRRAQYQKP